MGRQREAMQDVDHWRLLVRQGCSSEDFLVLDGRVG